jgi:glutathione peroxidase
MTPIPRAASLALVVLSAGFLPAIAASHTSHGAPPMPRTIYEFHVRTPDGKEHALAEYRGRTLLIVNTASRCGFTPQYEGLEALYEKYRARGFEVLAFPANDFMNQEPGTDTEIQSFCSLTYRTKFPVFAKIHVRGRAMAPLYAFLTKETGFKGDIAWNFTKFLVGPDGQVVARYAPPVNPLDRKVTEQIEGLLPTP